MLGNKPPYTTMQQLNLDWVLSKLKTLLRLVPDNGAAGQILRRTRDGAVWSDEQGGGGGGAVESVNGKTGAVVLDAADVGALPDDYTPPVTSVNGQTGAVVIPTGGAVDSVNGKTGAVVLGKSDIGLANVDNVKQYSATNPPPYPVTSVNGQTGAVVIPTGGTPLDAYPVGSIYMSVNSTSPASLFGGTWEQLEDRFLLAAGSTYTAGSTGGEATHTLTVTEMPSHRHGLTDSPANLAGRAGTGTNHFGTVQLDAVWASGYQTDATGGGQAHNNMPPYLAVYMWKRTA